MQEPESAMKGGKHQYERKHYEESFGDDRQSVDPMANQGYLPSIDMTQFIGVEKFEVLEDRMTSHFEELTIQLKKLNFLVQ